VRLKIIPITVPRVCVLRYKSALGRIKSKGFLISLHNNELDFRAVLCQYLDTLGFQEENMVRGSFF